MMIFYFAGTFIVGVIIGAVIGYRLALPLI